MHPREMLHVELTGLREVRRQRGDKQGVKGETTVPGWNSSSFWLTVATACKREIDVEVELLAAANRSVRIYPEFQLKVDGRSKRSSLRV